jgi:hypothetical protein
MKKQKAEAGRIVQLPLFYWLKMQTLRPHLPGPLPG